MFLPHYQKVLFLFLSPNQSGSIEGRNGHRRPLPATPGAGEGLALYFLQKIERGCWPGVRNQTFQPFPESSTESPQHYEKYTPLPLRSHAFSLFL